MRAEQVTSESTNTKEAPKLNLFHEQATRPVDHLIFDYCPSSDRLEQAVLNVIARLDLFTADDLHVIENEIADCRRDRRVIGAILASLERKGYIEKHGYVRSQRKECHNRPVLQWVNLHTKGASE